MFASGGNSSRLPGSHALALILGVAALLLGCPSKKTGPESSTEVEKIDKLKIVMPPEPPVPAGFEDPPASAWEYSKDKELAGLKMHLRGAPLDAAKRMLVLFHGYGAEGDDLVPLSTVVDVGDQGAFVFPIAPVELPRGGRAWFRRDQSNFLTAVTRAQEFVDALATKYPNSEMIVGGFSQGAMLAVNLLERTSTPARAVIIWSPADLLIAPLTGNRTETAVFLSHGSSDPVLPFLGANRLKSILEDSGYQVAWVPFAGRHAIPRSVIEQLNTFLDALPSANTAAQTAPQANSPPSNPE